MFHTLSLQECKPGAVAHTCYPATQEVEIRRIAVFKTIPGKKLGRPLSNIPDMAYNPSYSGGRDRRIKVRG
jgi:hypothetical protein